MTAIDIVKLRERLGYPGKPISQADLGRRLGGVSQSTISRLEEGKTEADGPMLMVLRQLDEEAPEAKADCTAMSS